MRTLCGLFLCCASLFFTCAHQVAPSGGPKDEESPVVVRVVPPSGTLNHPVRKKIVLYFSEWVDIRNVKQSITVFPTLAEGFKVTVGGRRVEIAPKKAFAESTTYHIGITTTLTDLHGISVGKPFTVIFSTGSSIDSGMVTGCVVDAEKETVQPKVALYRCTADTVPDTTFFNLPSYLIQTDSEGTFSFSHIRSGTYILLAFDDQDNNNTISPGKERVYASRERKLVLERNAGPFVLFPVFSDTLSARVKQIQAVSATVISGEWIEGATYGMEDNAWHIFSLDSAIIPPKIETCIPIKDSRFFALRLQDSLTTGSYSLVYTINRRIAVSHISEGEGETAVLHDTIRFNGTLFSDTVAPCIKGIVPKDNAELDSKIAITWSEPVQALTGAWYITDSLNDTIPLVVDTSFSETTVFTPQHRFKPEHTYFFSIPAGNFKDITGNYPRIIRDTTRADTTADTMKKDDDTTSVITCRFSTIAMKDLCYSLCGGASCLEPETRRIWQYIPFERSAVYTTRDSSGHFCFDSIPGDKGRLGYFVDYNEDKVYTIGTLFPWMPPESRFVFPDTIEARARWDIEGIEVPACDTCPRVEMQPLIGRKEPQDTVKEGE